MIEKDSNKIGSVLRILDKRTLIVSAGKEFLSPGDDIAVYESLDTLKDLDGTDLCVIERTKAILEVIEVNDLYSICKYQEAEIIKTALALSPLLAESNRKVYVPLKVDEDDIDPLPETNNTIHIGDPIKLIYTKPL